MIKELKMAKESRFQLFICCNIDKNASLSLNNCKNLLQCQRCCATI